MKLLVPFILLSLLAQFAISQDNISFQGDKLIKKWETAPVFKVPESVCFDPGSHILYVSNINGKPTEKDGNGYIALLSPDGTVTKGRSITGLHAPKGMGIYEQMLYVTDIDRVAAIDLKSLLIVRFYDFPEAKFLNDIAIDQKGAVYISDMMSSRIYRIYGEKTETWLDDMIIANPNGLFIEDDNLLIGCGKIVKASLADKKLSVLVDDTGSIDGLEGTGDGRYLFSDWQGNVYLTGTDKKIEKILDTSAAGINAADIEYIPTMKLLFVPTFNDNRVMAYELK
jgi:DNA-binding beta-propeller fold protein YncE